MKNKQILVLAVLCITILFFTFSCKPDTNNEEEVITTLKLSFTNGSSFQVYNFRDIDGIGGGADGVADTIVLDSNNLYVMSTSVLNESVTPAEDITAEIQNESKDHQFFYNISSGLNLTHIYTDTDDNSRPIGLANTISTGSRSTGTIRVNLKHQPGIKDGNQNTGASDIDVSFVVIIK